jgi:hypothetical protein
MDEKRHDEIVVSVQVDGADVDDATVAAVLAAYEETIETFLRKNDNYNNSFVNSAKIESIMQYGEVRDDRLDDVIARQIFVRGMLDKMSRFYSLQFCETDDRVGEQIDDTLLDMGNYAVMLAAMMRQYGDTDE